MTYTPIAAPDPVTPVGGLPDGIVAESDNAHVQLRLVAVPTQVFADRVFVIEDANGNKFLSYGVYDPTGNKGGQFASDAFTDAGVRSAYAEWDVQQNFDEVDEPGASHTLASVDGQTSVTSQAAFTRANLMVNGHAAQANADPLLRLRSHNADWVVVAGDGKIGLNGATPQAKGSTIADASGGATIDSQARTALNALLAYLRLRGDIAV